MSTLKPQHREFRNPRVLARLLQPLPAHRLQEAAADHDWDKWSRKITFEPYFRLLLLLGLTRYGTLTELQRAAREDPLFRQSGAQLEVSVSALAQVPGRRGSGPFLALLQDLLDQIALLPRQPRRCKALTTANLRAVQHLLAQTQIIDSTTFALPPAVAAWARTHDTGPGAAGYKLHLRLAGDYGGLAQVDFSPAREHDRPHLDPLAEHAGAGDIMLVDRGYQDYGLFAAWTAKGVHFVTRLKANAQVVVLETREHPEDAPPLPNGYRLRRELRVRLGPARSAGSAGSEVYRLLDVIGPSGEFMTLLTNLPATAATAEQVCTLYLYRWTIETLFRWLKHALGLKHLISTTKEGVEIQVAMALLVYALLVLYQQGEPFSPKYLLLQFQWELQRSLLAFMYELGRSGEPPPPELAAYLDA